jgi:hypothetical protein
MLHVLSLFIIAFLSKNKPAQRSEDFLRNEKETAGERLKKMYTQALPVSIPVAVYGSIVYLAVFHPWKTILIFMIVFVVSFTIDYFQNNRKQRA